MILFLYGEDSFRMNERRIALQKAFVAKYPGADILTFDFEDQRTPDHVRLALGACSEDLFVGHKMVVLLNPFRLAEPEEALLINFLTEFRKASTNTTVLLASPEKLKKTHPLACFLLKQSDMVEAYDKPDVRDMATHIKRELRTIDAQAAFSPQALQTFAAIIGGDTARMRTELEKLSLFKPGGVFEEGDVRLLVGATSENAIFEALDALSRDDKKRAIVLLNREALGGDGVYPVLAMCAWHLRRLLQVREAFDRGVQRTTDIASQTKLPPFVVQKMLGTIRTLPLSRIKEGFAILADFDTGMKTGVIDPAVALDLFVWRF